MRVFFIILFTLVSSCKVTGNEIVAKVNGEKITKAEFTRAFNYELSKYDPKILNDQERLKPIKKAVLDKLIQDTILYLKAKEAGITATGSELADEYVRYKSQYTEAAFQKMLQLKGMKYEDWKEEKRREFLIDKLIDQEVASKIDISDADIKKYYNQHKKDFTRGDEVHARQIVVDELKKAEELHAKAVKGENFAAMATEFSIAPEAKNGGDLGWFPRGVMPKEFDDACFPLPAGMISPIVRTEYGYHIFKVIERRPAAVIPLKDVKDKIVQLARRERMEKAFDEWYEPIKKRAKVEIKQ